MSKRTVCLNMIVRNEAPVIRRCLDSVRPFIDSWVIVDTGSTDGTQDRIRELLADLPGELHERPWVDFAHNRTEALRLAEGRGDYLLFIDADEALEIEPGFVMPPLEADLYWIQIRYGGCTYVRKQLVRNSGVWRYEGILHEYLTTDGPFTEGTLTGLVNVPRHDGARARDPLTYRRDALLLENALLTEPDNVRYVFYLAQSYRDANDLEMALLWYERRVAIGGRTEEVWYSLYQVASLKERLKKPWPEVLEAYLAAYQNFPDRAEPLFRIAMHYQGRNEYATAQLFLSRAAAVPEPGLPRLFVERALYTWQIQTELAVASFYVRDQKTAIEMANRALRSGKVPPEAVDHVIRNRRWSLAPPADAPRCEPGRVHVVVTFRDPGPELDDCVESLLQQECAEWDAVFIDDGSAADHAARVPADDPRVRLIRHEQSRGAEACLAEHLREHADPDAIVFPMSAGERFGDRSAIGKIRSAFTEAGCTLVYGQFRSDDGSLGDAEPASCEEDFRARGSALASGAPAAFRGRSWQGSTAALFRDAGFGGTRFLDDVLTARIAPRAVRPRDVSVEDTPLISCLMVTRDRLALAKRSIRCFAAQTWPNRELVIVTDGEPRYRDALERFVRDSGIEGVRFVDPGPGLPLGALRNVSLNEARGEIVCQWDDDDGNHPDRLRVQAEDMVRRGARASFLTDHLQWIADQRVLCWVDWSLGGITGEAALFPGSLMMFNDARFRYPEDGPYARQGEDSVFLHRLYDSVPVVALTGAGHLYLYEYHGRNTFSREHHLHLTNFRKPASEIQAEAGRLREALGHYEIARPAVVFGKEGPVFAVR